MKYLRLITYLEHWRRFDLKIETHMYNPYTNRFVHSDEI